MFGEPQIRSGKHTSDKATIWVNSPFFFVSYFLSKMKRFQKQNKLSSFITWLTTFLL